MVSRLEAATHKPAELAHKLRAIERPFSFGKAKSLHPRGWGRCHSGTQSKAPAKKMWQYVSPVAIVR